MCHAGVIGNPGLFPRKRESREHGLLLLFGFPLARQGHAGFSPPGRGQWLHSAKMLRSRIGGNPDLYNLMLTGSPFSQG